MSAPDKARYAAKRGQSRLKRHTEKTVGEFEFQIAYYQKLRRDLFDKLNRNELSGNQVMQLREALRHGVERGLSPAECEKLSAILGQPERRKMSPLEAKKIDQLNNKIRELNEIILPYMLPKLASVEHRPDDDTAETLKLIRARISGEALPEGEFVEQEPLLLP